MYGPESFGGSRHGAPGSQDPEDAIEDAKVIHPWYAARLVLQPRPDGSPFLVGAFVAVIRPLRLEIESWLDVPESGRVVLILSFVELDPKRSNTSLIALAARQQSATLSFPMHGRGRREADHMRRRVFIAGAAATAAMGFSKPICAQDNATLPVPKRIAIFHPTEPPEGLTVNGRRAYKTYFAELSRLGYAEGQNLVVERYSLLGHYERFEGLAHEMVASHPDVIVCVSGFLARRVKPMTTSIPILATSADPIAAGLVTNLAKPDENITGVSADAGLEVNAKRLQFLQEATRNLRNVRFLSAASRGISEKTVAVVQEAARQTSLTLAVAALDEKIDREAYERAFDAMEKDRVDGVIVSDSPEHLTHRQLIVDLAAKYRLPAIYPFREFVEVGGLLSYGIDTADMMRRLAGMTAEVLRGTKPGEIPFQQQTKFELLLNQKTAKSLSLEFPVSLLAVAVEVIE